MSLLRSAAAMREAAIVMRKAAIEYPGFNGGRPDGDGWNRAADVLERNADHLDMLVKEGRLDNYCLDDKE